MSTPEQRVAEATGATASRRVERIQSVWGGYGELARFVLSNGPAASVVVEHVQPVLEGA